MSFEFGYLGKFEVKFETKLGFESGGPVFRLITYYWQQFSKLEFPQLTESLPH